MQTTTLTTADGTLVCSSCLLAIRPWQRLRGLLGRSGLAAGEGMYFRPAGSIHMFFMRFAIDAIFLDRDLNVIDVERGLQPWKMASRRGAKVVIEVADGAAAGVQTGDRLVLGTIEG
ncbi:MAG: DUF192 domain-containing protein [Actinobacteria bacterium]|nr:DUF192 domain-containing protein [Actinomycetota bacterium]